MVCTYKLIDLGKGESEDNHQIIMESVTTVVDRVKERKEQNIRLRKVGDDYSSKSFCGTVMKKYVTKPKGEIREKLLVRRESTRKNDNGKRNI